MALTLATVIRQRREALGLKQSDLAVVCNSTQAAVSRWESGRSIPEPEFFEGLMKGLLITVDDFKTFLYESHLFLLETRRRLAPQVELSDNKGTNGNQWQ